MSMGYIKTTIDFTKLEHLLAAAKSLDLAGDTRGAEDILLKMADQIKSESGIVHAQKDVY